MYETLKIERKDFAKGYVEQEGISILGHWSIRCRNTAISTLMYNYLKQKQNNIFLIDEDKICEVYQNTVDLEEQIWICRSVFY